MPTRTEENLKQDRGDEERNFDKLSLTILQ